MFSIKEIVGDVRASVVGMITAGAVLFLGSLGGAIWKSVRTQPVPWTFLILIGFAGIILLLAAIIKLVKAEKSKQPPSELVHPVPYFQATPIMPAIPEPDLSHPFYDRFFPKYSPKPNVTAKLLPEPKQGAPVIVEIVNKSEKPARLYSAKLFGLGANGREESLLTPRHIIASDLQQWKGLPFVMEPKSRIKIAFAGMCLALLPQQFIGYLVEIELEDETRIRTEKRLRSSNDKPRRTINYNQETEIIRLLKGAPLRPIWITTKKDAYKNDEEAHNYWLQLTWVFTKAGVPIEGQAAVDVGTLFPNGVSLFWKESTDNDVTASLIIDAVRITGVECKHVDRQPNNRVEPEINLMIGTNELMPPS